MLLPLADNAQSHYIITIPSPSLRKSTFINCSFLHSQRFIFLCQKKNIIEQFFRAVWSYPTPRDHYFVCLHQGSTWKLSKEQTRKTCFEAVCLFCGTRDNKLKHRVGPDTSFWQYGQSQAASGRSYRCIKVHL